MSNLVIDPSFNNIKLPNEFDGYDKNLFRDIAENKTSIVNSPVTSRFLNNDVQFKGNATFEKNEKLSRKHPPPSVKANSDKLVPIQNLYTSNSENFDMSG